jgi:hypothetical protein
MSRIPENNPKYFTSDDSPLLIFLYGFTDMAKDTPCNDKNRYHAKCANNQEGSPDFIDGGRKKQTEREREREGERVT